MTTPDVQGYEICNREGVRLHPIAAASLLQASRKRCAVIAKGYRADEVFIVPIPMPGRTVDDALRAYAEQIKYANEGGTA